MGILDQDEASDYVDTESAREDVFYGNMEIIIGLYGRKCRWVEDSGRARGGYVIISYRKFREEAPKYSRLEEACRLYDTPLVPHSRIADVAHVREHGDDKAGAR